MFITEIVDIFTSHATNADFYGPPLRIASPNYILWI